MKVMIRVEYIPTGIVYSGNVKSVSDRLTELNDDSDVIKWYVEYLTNDGKLTGVIITYYVEVEEEVPYV